MSALYPPSQSTYLTIARQSVVAQVDGADTVELLERVIR